jgi:hypothetical protein
MLLTESGFASTIFGHGIFTCLLSERRRGLRQRVLNKDYLRGSIVAGTRWVDLRPYPNHTSRRGIVDVVGPYADRAGNPFRRNMENTGRDLLDPAARIHKAVEQIARSEGRVSGKVLQSGPGDRAWMRLPSVLIVNVRRSPSHRGLEGSILSHRVFMSCQRFT